MDVDLTYELLRTALSEREKARDFGMWCAYIALESMICTRLDSLGGLMGEW